MASNKTRLVEIAVVIVVIATSIGVLLPALGAGSIRDDLTLCFRRVMNLSAVTLQYTEDNDGILPPGKYGYQSGNPVPEVWMELLHKPEYLDMKEDVQCPADDVTNNEALYYDYGPAYPAWWASYAMSMNLCDLFWVSHDPGAAVLSNHSKMLDKQILYGESECNCILGAWFAPGPGSDPWSFRGSYTRQFPFDRHKAFCVYSMLDGHGKIMRVPASDAVDDAAFESEIRAQFEKCEGIAESKYASHVCFWNRYQRAIYATDPSGE